MEKKIQEVKMKKFLTLTLIFTFLTLSVAVVFAQPPQRMPRGDRMFERPQNRILAVMKANQEELNITEEQLEQVQNLVFSFQERSLKMRNEDSLSRLELQKVMQDRENLDYDKIKAILSKSSAVRNEMFVERLKLREEINNVLTPEQREALKAKTREGIRNRARDLRDRMQQRIPRPRNRIRR
jgi:Spy/CpxP family protein refolding chaperone